MPTARDNLTQERLGVVVDPIERSEFEQRGVPADRSCGDDTARHSDAGGFFQCATAVGLLDEVIERAEQQGDVRVAVGFGQLPRITDGCRHTGYRRGNGDVFGHEVDDVHPVAVLGEPARAHAGGPAHIEYPSRRGRQVPAQQLAGAIELQPSMRSDVESIVLDEAVGVVGVQIGHGWPSIQRW